MLPGGRFRVEGDDYTATAFAAYKRPLENTIRYVKDSALEAYLAQQIGLGRGTNVGDYLARCRWRSIARGGRGPGASPGRNPFGDVYVPERG